MKYNERKEVLKDLKTNKLNIILPVYYSEDDKGNILIDCESIQDEFNSKLNELKELVE